MVVKRYVPEKGDFVAVTFDPQSGHEQKGRRPALVVSNTLFNERTGMAIVCPLTNTDRRFPFHVAIADDPSVTGFVKGKDAEFPSLFRTITNLEEWIGRPRTHPLSDRIGKAIAWLVSFILVWGMIFLMMHLTLYPFPNITHILNHSG